MTFTQGALQVMTKDARPLDKLLSLVNVALDHTDEWEDHCAVYVDYFGAARTDGGDRFSLAGIYGEMESILQDLIEQEKASGEIDNEFNSAAVAELLVSMFDGIILHRIFEGDGSSRDSIRTTAVRFIKQGLLTRTNRESA